MKTITIKTDGKTCVECMQNYSLERGFRDKNQCHLNYRITDSGVCVPGPDCPGSGEYVLVDKQEYLKMKSGGGLMPTIVR